MKLTKLLSTASLLGLLVVGNAQAADLLYSAPAPSTITYDTGPYAAIRGSYVSPQDVDALFGAGPFGVTGDLDDGFAISGALGWKFGKFGFVSPRGELEVDYSNTDLSSGQFFNAAGPVGAPFAAGGKVETLAGFANVLIDVPVGFGFTPFFGGGVGFANVDLSANAGGPNLLDDSDTVFAYKLTAGISYEITRGVTLEGAYNYVNFQSVNAGPGVAGLNVNDDIEQHRFTAGLRLAF